MLSRSQVASLGSQLFLLPSSSELSDDAIQCFEASVTAAGQGQWYPHELKAGTLSFLTFLHMKDGFRHGDQNGGHKLHVQSNLA